LIQSQLRLDRISVNYSELGEGHPTLVLLHGLASNQRIWDLVAPQLATRHRIYTYDQRGHGNSEKPNSGYDFKTITDDLHSFLNKLNITKPILIGHSWGANVAVNYASTYPHTLKGICLVDGGFIEISKIPENTLSKALISMAPPDFTNYTQSDFKERLNQRDWGEQDETSSAANLTEIVLSNFVLQPNGKIHPKFSRSNHMQVIEAFWNHQPSKLFSGITCPVLYLPARMPGNESQRNSMKDDMIRLASKSLTTFNTIWLENSIHDVPIQKPELLSSIILSEIEKGFFD